MAAMNLYPLFADVRDRAVLVVGGGAVAARKAEMLVRAGAQVRVGAVALGPSLARMLTDRRVQHLPGHFQTAWLNDVWLAVAATDDTALNARVAAAAETRHLWVNVVDDARLSRFHVPAIVDRSPLLVAISSGGMAPVLATRLRQRIEVLLEPSLGALAALAGRYRRRIRRRHRDMGLRRAFHDWLLDGPVHHALRAGRAGQAERTLANALATRSCDRAEGHVTLVGAGPGDAGLLTLHGLRALGRADVILHDRLVADQVLDLARRDARRIDVGKRVGENHQATQNRIHRLMREYAAAGLQVVRLKGGDPFVFGRGGEELEYLRAHGIDYSVVPGITAAVACAAYAGVPLTHRGHAQSLHITTVGRTRELDALDWAALARQKQTLAIYMGVAKLELLTRQLLRHGRAADTPFVLVENGTCPNQRVLTGTLGTLPAVARRQQLRAPAMLILGEVASCASQSGWFGAHAEQNTPWRGAA